jgi:hypothetical protein
MTQCKNTDKNLTSKTCSAANTEGNRDTGTPLRRWLLCENGFSIWLVLEGSVTDHYFPTPYMNKYS